MNLLGVIPFVAAMLIVSSSLAGIHDNDNLNVKITLLTSTVCAHEPASFSIVLENDDDHRIGIDLGRNGEEFISVQTLRDKSNWTGGRLPTGSGFAGVRILRLIHGEERELRFTINKWTGDLPEGRNALKLALHVPPTERNWDPPSDLVVAGAISQETVVNLEVTPPCPSHLESLAQEDLRTILADGSVETKQRASEYLSYIYDDVAIPYMEQAVVKDGIGNRDLMDGLARIGDEKARIALVDLSSDPDQEISSYAHNKILQFKP